MDVNRLSQGEKIAAGSAVVLFILMFLNWFGISREDSGDISMEDARDLAGFVEANAESVALNAWQSFSFIDIVLVVAILAAVGFAAAKAASRTVQLPVASSVVVAALGVLATLLVLYRIIDPPYGLGREFFVFLGLLAAAGIAAGGYMAMQEEGTSFQEAGDRLRSSGDGPGSGPSTGAGPGAGGRSAPGPGPATGTDPSTERHPTSGTGTGDGEPPPPESPRTR